MADPAVQYYRIVRFYQRGHTKRKILKEGLTFDEAQDHCNNPETSSSTSSDNSHALAYGLWFDGYEKDPN